MLLQEVSLDGLASFGEGDLLTLMQAKTSTGMRTPEIIKQIVSVQSGIVLHLTKVTYHPSNTQSGCTKISRIEP